MSIKFGWQNYYHFYIDCLTQIALLDEYDPEYKIPIIVPRVSSHAVGDVGSKITSRTDVHPDTAGVVSA